MSANSDIGTRNVTIQGHLLNVSEKDSTRKYDRVTRNVTYVADYYVPIVDSKWVKSDPVKIIIKFSYWNQSDFDAIKNGTSFTGVIRNIWWEGLPSHITDEFVKDDNLKFDNNTILIEISEMGNVGSLILKIVIGTIIAGVVFPILIATLVYFRKRQKQLI